MLGKAYANDDSGFSTVTTPADNGGGTSKAKKKTKNAY
jgi:hypothetical protein